MHSASGPGEELSRSRHPPMDGFAWERGFEESCCHALGLLQILRLDCRKQGRSLGQESKRFSRDQKYLFSFNAQSYLCAPGSDKEARTTVFAGHWTITAFISGLISGIIPSEMTLDLLFLKLDAHSMNWPCHVMSHGKLHLFPNFFCEHQHWLCLRISPEGPTCVSHAVEIRAAHLASAHGRAARHAGPPALTWPADLLY